MTESAVRHLAYARNVPRVAAGLFETFVQIWDVESGVLLRQLETVLEFGGRRLTMSNDGSSCIAAAWRGGPHGGVCRYDTESGAIVWHRPDLAETQRIVLSPDESNVWWMPDTGALLRLDASTGETIDALKDIRRIVESRDATMRLLQRRHGGYILEGAGTVQLHQHSFGLLSAAFSETSVCISEAGSSVRCFSAEGTERWRYEPGFGAHVLHMWYSNSQQRFYAVRYDYRNGGHHLLTLDPQDGSHGNLTNLGDEDVDVSPEQDRLIATDGSVYELSSGSIVARLDFPRREVAIKDG